MTPTVEPPLCSETFAFILCVFSVIISSGAGAEMRRTLAAFSGMIGVTGLPVLRPLARHHGKSTST
jgi:hypothetical protein